MALAITDKASGGDAASAPSFIKRCSVATGGDTYASGGFDITSELEALYPDKTLVSAVVMKHPIPKLADINITATEVKLRIMTEEAVEVTGAQTETIEVLAIFK